MPCIIRDNLQAAFMIAVHRIHESKNDTNTDATSTTSLDASLALTGGLSTYLC